MANDNKPNYGPALSVLTSLFFMWGFITCLNGSLKPLLQKAFALNDFTTNILDGSFFIAFFIMSVPASVIVKKFGYKIGCVIGLLVCAIGAFLYVPAAKSLSFPLFCVATFVIASGVTVLQVAANPFVTILGSPEGASGRLNMTQAFNSLGTTLAPLAFSFLVFKGVAELVDIPKGTALTSDQIQQVTSATQTPYIGLALLLVVLGIVFALFKLPDPRQQNTTAAGGAVSETPFEKLHGSAWGYRHLLLGVFAIFAYVGAEVAIGNNLVRFLGDPSVAGLKKGDCAPFQAIYWGGAMIGRFFGGLLLGENKGKGKMMQSMLVLIFAFIVGWFVTHTGGTSWFGPNLKRGAIFLGIAIVNFIGFQIGKNSPNKSLGIFAIIATLLVVTTVFAPGKFSYWALISVGFFNSIMFPTIFSLGINKLGKHVPQGSGALCVGIVGGGLVPMLWGLVSDLSHSVKIAYLVCAVCYLYIAFYGVKGSTMEKEPAAS
jgi:MFS transporter, FHS family, L-fucose permease